MDVDYAAVKLHRLLFPFRPFSTSQVKLEEGGWV
jgi:hypothetical protein